MRTVRQWLGFLIVQLYPRRLEAGVPLIFTDLDASKDECTQRIRAATEVIRETPGRYQALVGKIRYVVVWAGDSCFADTFGGVHVPTEVVDGITTHALASILVHEAMHVRIRSLGIPFRPELRERIERICVREQASFLRDAPNNPDDSEGMASAAELALLAPWWTQAALDEDRERMMEVHNVPDWVRLLIRGRRRRSGIDGGTGVRNQ